MKPLDLAQFKQTFDPFLQKSLSVHACDVQHLTNDRYISQLTKHAETIVMAGGKRIRPYVAYLMYLSAGGTDAEAPRFFTGLELFHAFALMHDDIIDRGATRHAISTMHTFAQDGLEGTAEQIRHIAEGQAILVGDLLAHWAYQEIEAHIPDPNKLEALKVFHEMNDSVIVGEMLDVKLAARKAATHTEVMEKTTLKTAYYTFVHPMRIGARAAGTAATHDDFCKKYGLALGIAFQLQDDLLDILGDAKKLGKSTFSDMAEGQHTYFTQYIRDNGTSAQKEELIALFGQPLDDTARIRARSLFENSGAVKAGQEAIEKYCDEALQHLAMRAFPQNVHMQWESLVAKMRTRRE